MATDEKMSAEQILKALHEKEIAAKGKCQEDVGFVKESLDKGTYSKRDFLCDDLFKYIEEIDPESKKAPAFGKNVTLEGKEEEEAFLFLNQILSLGNAPLGKWVSKQNNPLWEQTEINLSIQKGEGDVFEETGKVIASKAKTAEEKENLLRELIANNVVERAILLSAYDKPDDAFQSFDFYHGEEKNHAYAEYPAKWHRIKEDRLNEYSNVFVSDDGKVLEQFAKDLQKDEKATGRVTAILADDAQRKAFYEKVLLPYIKAIKDVDLVKDHIPAYVKAKEAFLAQKKVVMDQQAKLGQLQQSFLKNWKEEKLQLRNQKAAEATIDHSKKDLEKAEADRKPLLEERDKVDVEMYEIVEKYEEANRDAQTAKTEWTRCNDTVRTGFDKEQELRASVNGMMKLLNKKKYDAIIAEADKYQKEAIEAQEKGPAAEKKMKELAAQAEALKAQKDEIQKKQEAVLDKLSQLNNSVNTARGIIARKEEELSQIKVSLESVKKEREALLEGWSKENGDDKRTMLDLQFIKDLTSKDAKVSDASKKENPWFSKNYQKEREKLFTLALELHKAFAEGSGCLAANLATLSQYLGYWKKGEEKIVFHEADRQDTVPFLWQSLFLFLPLTELSLASVTELMTDAKKAGLYGLIAVDGIEKTEPAKLIGAIYRGRHGVIFK